MATVPEITPDRAVARDGSATTPSFRLDGKRALVTGAGRGIGLAAAMALARSGAQVTLCARSTNDIESAAEAIAGHEGSAETLALDVTDRGAVERAIREREPHDILINNAGTNRPAPFLDVSVEDFDHMVDLNLRAAFFVAQSFCRRLVGAGRKGAVVNLSSQMGHVGSARRSVYCATKWAMEGFTRAMAIELGPVGIRVNTLCPTFIETPMTRSFFEDSTFRQEVERKIKLGRVGRVEDLTGAIVFLASDASALMTGASLVVDGGWTAD